jgi:hypothetical protein
MKMRVQVIACMVSFAFLLAAPSALAQADRLIGVWKITENKLPPTGKRKDTLTIAHQFPNLWIFTQKHFSHVEDPGWFGKQRSDLPEEPTAKQMEAAYSRFIARSGTYEVKGSTITFLPMVSKDPNLTNAPVPTSLDFKFEGDSLIIYLRQPGISGPIERIFTRLE